MLPRSNNPDNSLVGHVVTAIAKQRLPTLPRCFTLKYDNTKLSVKGRKLPDAFKQRIECEGTLYTNGHVTLDSGTYFEHGMTELKEHFNMTGKYTIVWSNGEEEGN